MPSLIVEKEAIFITTTQQSLVALAQHGDEQAFYQLIEQEQHKLYRMAYVYVQNENDAVEVFQQTIIRAFEGLAQLKEPHYFTTWLTRIMINCCKTYIAKKKKVQLVEPQTLEDLKVHLLHISRKSWIYGRLFASLRKSIKRCYCYDFIRTTPSRILQRFYNALKAPSKHIFAVACKHYDNN